MPRKPRPARRADVCPAWSRAALVAVRLISLRETALAGYRPHRAAIPSCHGCAPAPTAKPGACRASFALHFACGETRWPVIGPTGAAIFRSRHGCAAPGPQRQNPGACRRSAPFRLRETARPDVSPARARARCPIFALLKCGPAFPRVCRVPFVPRLALLASHPWRSAPFHPKTIDASGCPFLRNFPFFHLSPPFFFCIGSGAHRCKIAADTRRGFNTFQFPGSIFPSPTPEAVRPPPRRHIFLGFCIAIGQKNNLYNGKG